MCNIGAGEAWAPPPFEPPGGAPSVNGENHDPDVHHRDTHCGSHTAHHP